MYDEFDEIKNNLTPEDIIDILETNLDVHTYIDRESYLIFPTICHNVDSADAKLKLYYYKENKLFHCYTECSESFDIFGLFKRYYKLRKKEYDFYNDILYKIVNPKDIVFNKNTFTYKPQRKKYMKINRNIYLPVYSKNILDIFSKQYPIEWTWENISDATMEKFNIRFSILENRIIIPHYDINDNLVGIRGRALNQYDIENFGKYAPIRIEGKWYSHPLSLNLYGINFNREAIKKHKKVILLEGEKSVLLYNEYFGSENNISLAVCGSNLNKLQLELLIKNFELNEIIIAFDKEYVDYPSKKAENYFEKLIKIGKKYSHYNHFSFIYDTKGLLKEKDSPIDRGSKVFEKLLKERVHIK